MSYTAQINSTLSMIARKGRTATLRKKVWDTSMVNPVTDEQNSSEPREFHDLPILVLDASPKAARKFADQGLTIESLRDFYLPAKGLTVKPEPGDEFVVGGTTWIVLPGVGCLDPDGTPILYQGSMRL